MNWGTKKTEKNARMLARDRYNVKKGRAGKGWKIRYEQKTEGDRIRKRG